MDNFEPAAQRQNRASGAILGEKAMRATLEWRAARLRDEIKRLREMELDVLADRIALWLPPSRSSSRTRRAVQMGPNARKGRGIYR
jgi:hypothetical protein